MYNEVHVLQWGSYLDELDFKCLVHIVMTKNISA
jgi:hypothetical protein